MNRAIGPLLVGWIRTCFGASMGRMVSKQTGYKVAKGVLAGGLLFLVSSSVVWGMGSRVPAVGTAAEEFRLVDLEGRQQSLGQYRGKIVLVNFLGHVV